MEGMADFFGDIVVPTEDVATFTRDGKRRISKRKLLPGYIMVNMIINDDTWFLVRETNGISDFTGAAGKPMPMEPSDIERFITKPVDEDEEEAPIKIGIPYKSGDRVRVKEGSFENQEGEVDSVDKAVRGQLTEGFAYRTGAGTVRFAQDLNLQFLTGFQGAGQDILAQLLVGPGRQRGRPVPSVSSRC